jgi:hypothetical protein
LGEWVSEAVAQGRGEVELRGAEVSGREERLAALALALLLHEWGSEGVRDRREVMRKVWVSEWVRVWGSVGVIEWLDECVVKWWMSVKICESIVSGWVSGW